MMIRTLSFHAHKLMLRHSKRSWSSASISNWKELKPQSSKSQSEKSLTRLLTNGISNTFLGIKMMNFLLSSWLHITWTSSLSWTWPLATQLHSCKSKPSSRPDNGWTSKTTSHQVRNQMRYSRRTNGPKKPFESIDLCIFAWFMIRYGIILEISLKNSINLI